MTGTRTLRRSNTKTRKTTKTRPCVAVARKYQELLAKQTETQSLPKAA
jgi:hypothetical protein